MNQEGKYDKKGRDKPFRMYTKYGKLYSHSRDCEEAETSTGMESLQTGQTILCFTTTTTHIMIMYKVLVFLTFGLPRYKLQQS